MNMLTTPVSDPAPGSRAVLGLEHGRERAHAAARRTRRKNVVLNAALVIVAAAFVAFGGYVGWQVFEASENEPVNGPTVPLSPTEAIERLEEQPRWGGPGTPAFGVGDEP